MHVSFDAGRLARKIPTHLRTLSCKMATSPLSGKQAFEPARSPRALADSVRSVRSAGLYALGATSVCFLVGECGAGAICRLCRRCARVARGRGSRLAPLGHGPCAPSMSARAAGHWPSVAGRTSLSLCGRLWTLTCVYGTVFARLGDVRALAGRCGGGVGGVGGASAMHVCDAWLYALGVCMCDCTS